MPGRSKRFNLLIVSRDGRSLARLYVPRGLASTVLAGGVLAASTLAAIWADDVVRARQREELTALRQLTLEQRRLLEVAGRHLTLIQAEVESWRGLHARIWEPLGPDAPGNTQGSGVGGASNPLDAPEAPEADLTTRLEQLTASTREEGQKLRALERFMARAGKVLAALPSRWPVRGQVNSEFGRRLSPWTSAPESHSGIDIAARIGTPVKAPAPGVVLLAGPVADYGNTVVIDHGHDVRTLFGHLHRVQVTAGQRVDRGQPIALTGNSGKSSGPHLHYEITVKGRPVDPRRYLWD